jgi:hypothetical protein
MAKESFIEKQEANLSIHIFSVSATLVGVCLTVIGIINILPLNKNNETINDDILAVAAFLFLICCVLSYFALKIEDRTSRLRLEKRVDVIFLVGIGLMSLICFFIVLKI